MIGDEVICDGEAEALGVKPLRAVAVVEARRGPATRPLEDYAAGASAYELTSRNVTAGERIFGEMRRRYAQPFIARKPVIATSGRLP